MYSFLKNLLTASRYSTVAGVNDSYDGIVKRDPRIEISHKRTTKPHLTFCPLPRAQKFSPAPLSRANYMAYFRFAHL